MNKMLVLMLGSLTACTVGQVKDTSGIAITGVGVTAYGQCTGVGCVANQVQTPILSASLTGYRATTNADGSYFYDPYAKTATAANAMVITVPTGAPGNFYKMQFSKLGYQDIWLDYTPAFTNHVHEGTTYAITAVPKMHLCRNDENDADGDGICDAAEVHYGTSASKSDTDDDGKYDDQEIFGTGSPLAVQTRKFLHYNINVSNFATSKSFYELLGFRVLLEVDVNVTDPNEAQGLNLPPYQLHAAPMVLSDGFIIDLIRFQTPYNPEPPHSGAALGMTTITMNTENIVADIQALVARGVPYTVDAATNGGADIQAISFADPDGLPIKLLRKAGPLNLNPNYAHGILGPTIYVSDMVRSLAFYKKVGFKQRAGRTGLSLGDTRDLQLTQISTSNGAYADLNHLGLARTAIVTTNIDRDIQVLQASGIQFYTSQAITPSGPLGFVRYVCFEDPDGTAIELVEYN